MLPIGLVIDQKLDGVVRIEAEGSGGMGFGNERVSASNLETATRQAVLDSGLFRAVSDSSDCDYVLKVRVAKLSDPEPDLFPEVEAAMVWRMTNAAGDRVLWEHTIQTTGKADPDDHLDYQARESIATGRAVAKNLAQGIERISKLQFDD
tara:strand:- start:82 stop:531 length:450 start_codon:yes stop_codon:yes gene_type:complete